MESENPRESLVETITRIRDEIQEWSSRNFPNNTPYEPLLGMGEELGEMKHAVLKMRQGIRGTVEEHRAALKDGFGDFLIYLLDYSWRMGLVVSDFIADDYFVCEPGGLTEGFGLLARNLGVLELWYEYAHADRESSPTKPDADLLSVVALQLVRVAAGYGVDPFAALVETWSRVKERDWTKNKATGEVGATS